MSSEDIEQAFQRLATVFEDRIGQPIEYTIGEIEEGDNDWSGEDIVLSSDTRERLTEVADRLAADMERRLLHGDGNVMFPSVFPQPSGRYEVRRELEQRMDRMEIEQVITYSDGTEERHPFMSRDQIRRLGITNPTGRERRSPLGRIFDYARNYSMGPHRMSQIALEAPDNIVDRYQNTFMGMPVIANPNMPEGGLYIGFDMGVATQLDFSELEARVQAYLDREETPQQDAIAQAVRQVMERREDGFVQAGRRRIRVKRST